MMSVDPQGSQILDRWESARLRGDSLSAEQLCLDCPHHLDEVKRRIASLLERKRSGTPDSRRLSGEATARHNPEPLPDSELLVRSQLDSFQFHAQGGLGVVYTAQDDQLHREVAVKFIRRQHADDVEGCQQFLVEAEVTGRLEHPGVVPVYGLGRDRSGRPFYVMRFIQGETLDDALKRYHDRSHTGYHRRWELHQLLARFVAVCKTIAYAHNRGIVHRDVKPANIMLGRYGETLVLDWGLALPVGRDDGARASGERTLMPQAGSQSGSSSAGAAGTPQYMSPEQAAGTLEIGPATDIYSLGATLYKLLTGSVPFLGTTVFEIMQQVKRGDYQAVRDVRPDLPAALEAIVQKAMAMRPEDRYTSALQLAADVEQYLADEPVSAYREGVLAKTGRWVRKHRSTAIAALCGLLLTMAFAAVAAIRQSSLAESEHAARLEAEAARDRGLLLTAQFAARNLASEIESIQRTLELEALDEPLRNALKAIDENPAHADEATQQLQAWVDALNVRQRNLTSAMSWFVTDARGIQRARSPFAKTTFGMCFAARDYFHGQGCELSDSEMSEPPKPLTRPHLSRVFSSKSTEELTVAFSVPVWSGPPRSPDSKVLGVLALTIAANRFAAMRTGLSSDEMAVLVDLREDTVQGDSQAGLILHHRLLREAREQGGSLERKFPRIDAAMIARLRQLTDSRLKAHEDHPEGGAPIDMHESLLHQYPDPVAGGLWTAAMEPVLIARPVLEANEFPLQASGWAVIVQRRDSGDHAEASPPSTPSAATAALPSK